LLNQINATEKAHQLLLDIVWRHVDIDASNPYYDSSITFYPLLRIHWDELVPKLEEKAHTSRDNQIFIIVLDLSRIKSTATQTTLSIFSSSTPLT
jgi:hypothetical protein